MIAADALRPGHRRVFPAINRAPFVEDEGAWSLVFEYLLLPTKIQRSPHLPV